MTGRGKLLSGSMLQRLLTSLLLAGLTAAPSRSATIEVPLAYRPVKVDLQFNGTLGIRWSGMPASVASNRAAVVLPPDASSRATVITAAYGSRSFLFMVDADSTNAPFFNRAVFDANRNGNLSDDLPLPATLRLRGNGYHFMRAPVALNLGMAGRETWEFVLEVGGWGFSNNNWTNRPTPHAELFFACGLFGEARVGEHSYEIQVQDANGNGRYGEVTLEDWSPNHDAFRIRRIEGNDAKSGRDYVARCMPSFLVVGSRTFRLNVEPSGRSCSLEEFAQGAALVLPDSVFCGELKSAKDVVLFVDPATTVQLPAGDYTMRRFFLQRSDTNGFRWVVQTDHGGSQGNLKLRAGMPATMEIPEPYTLFASADRTQKGDGYRICVGMSDAKGGSLNTDLAVPGLRAPPPPVATVLKEDGTVVRVIKMGYG
jgi:hypothetical protein